MGNGRGWEDGGTLKGAPFLPTYEHVSWAVAEGRACRAHLLAQCPLLSLDPAQP